MEEKNEQVLTPLDSTNAGEVARAIIKILDEKSARDIKLMRVAEKTTLTEYFIVCSGTSNVQRRALSNYVEEGLEKRGVKPSRIEGYDSAAWIVMDYFNVILHIFDSESRDFYKIEKLWSGANEVTIDFNSKEE